MKHSDSKSLQRMNEDSEEYSSDNFTEVRYGKRIKPKKPSTKIKLNNNQPKEENDKELSNTQVNKTTFIPAIYLHDANNYQQILKDIKKLIKQDFSTKLVGNSFKVMLTDQNDFEILTEFYKNQNVSFHTCRCPSDQKLSVAIKGVPHSLTVEELSETIERKFPLIRIKRVINKNNKLTSTCFVELVNNEEGRKILNLEYIYYSKVTVEMWRMDSSSHCRNCENYERRWSKKLPKSVDKQPSSFSKSTDLESTVENAKCNFCENYHTDFMLCPYYEKLFLKMDHKTINFHSNKSDDMPKQTENVEETNKISKILKEYRFDCDYITNNEVCKEKKGRIGKQKNLSKPKAVDNYYISKFATLEMVLIISFIYTLYLLLFK